MDPAWALSFLLVFSLLFLLSDAWLPRKILILSLGALWSLRLGIFLAIRVGSHHPVEDSRYTKLRAKYEPHVGRRMFGFFQFQAVSVPILALPFFLSLQSKGEGFYFPEIAGALVVLLSLFGEAMADRQADRFKKDPANREKVCKVGLWRYSRHPNYFFEWGIWMGFGIMALATPWGFLGLSSPLIMYLLLTKVTGIPPAEAQSLKKRGEEYRKYQRETNAFFPWFARKES